MATNMNPADMTPEQIEEATYMAVSQVIQPTVLQPSGFLGVSITLLVIVVGVVALRLWTNHNHAGRIFIDDYICFVSITCLSWNIAIFYILLWALNRDARDVTVDWFTPYAAVGIFAGNMALYTAKLPLLFFYIRTFSVVKWLRYTSIALVVVGGLGFLGTATYASVTCSPQIHGDEFPPVAFFTCILGITNACIARASISLTMDVVMFFLPMPVIKGLNLPFRRKAGLALVFTAGFLAIAASAVGLYFQDEQQRGGSSDNFANALVLTVVESAIVILVSCAPALHLFWTKHFRRLFSGLGIDRLTGRSSNNISGGSDSKPSKRGIASTAENSRSGGIQVRTDHYIELSDSLTYKQPGS